MLRTLKVLLGRSRHELTDHPDRITEIGSSDCQVYEASDNLVEPRWVAYLSVIGTKLDGSVRGVETDLQEAIPNLKSIPST